MIEKNVKSECRKTNREDKKIFMKWEKQEKLLHLSLLVL